LLRDAGIDPTLRTYEQCLVMETQAYVLDGSCSGSPNTDSLITCLCGRACGSCARRVPAGANCQSDCERLWRRPPISGIGGVATE
jgi:hypothetical protein